MASATFVGAVVEAATIKGLIFNLNELEPSRP
jgi:hypothetical protein